MASVLSSEAPGLTLRPLHRQLISLGEAVASFLSCSPLLIFENLEEIICALFDSIALATDEVPGI